jgi:hypothetical protein
MPERDGAVNARARAAAFGLSLSMMMPTPSSAGPARDYAVVVSQETRSDAGWRKVVDALVEKHGATVISWDSSVDEVLPELRRLFPRYACFVARPGEATREFIGKVHRLARKLDDDPYPDCFWGVLTGYDSANALRIARQSGPLTVRKVAGGTDVGLDLCEEGVWYSENRKNMMTRKKRGGVPAESGAPDDTTKALVRTLTEYRADLFVTSGHATERDWQIGYSYPNGQFRCEKGVLYGLDMKGKRHVIRSPNPKVYLPVGNCLMGHIDGPDCMALAWMNSAGVDQMIGYTVDTWYGYAGWGCLDYFCGQPGRYSLTEAFFANQVALIHRLATFFPGAEDAELDSGGRPLSPVRPAEGAREAGLTEDDASGLLYDRDVVAFYGDPAWEARMAPNRLGWKQDLTERDGTYTLEIVPLRGKDSFGPARRNGLQAGGRPIVQFLPHRVREVSVVEGTELKPVVGDDFILVPNPDWWDPSKKYLVRFRALRAG